MTHPRVPSAPDIGLGKLRTTGSADPGESEEAIATRGDRDGQRLSGGVAGMVWKVWESDRRSEPAVKTV